MSIIEFIGVDPQTLGIAGLITLIVLMILAGFLIPSKTHDRLMHAKDEEIDRWRAALESSEAARMLQGEAMEKLLEQGELTQHVVEALHSVLGQHQLPATQALLAQISIPPPPAPPMLGGQQ